MNCWNVRYDISRPHPREAHRVPHVTSKDIAAVVVLYRAGRDALESGARR
jgi:hypothetical protein